MKPTAPELYGLTPQERVYAWHVYRAALMAWESHRAASLALLAVAERQPGWQRAVEVINEAALERMTKAAETPMPWSDVTWVELEATA